MLSSIEYLNLSGLVLELQHIEVGLLTETNADLLNVKEYLEVRIKDLQERYQQKH
jgi:hypothetical protein|tara:strand:- start:15896 stop:16060 length:165 start_codon:yes stop_codon:yes gene_type:complete